MKIVTAGVLVALFAVPLAAAAQQPSLAELARKEQERRKAVKVPGKVYTDKDVRSAPRPASSETGAGAPTSPTPATDTPAAAGASGTPRAAAAGGDTRDQAWWKARIDTAREELRRAEMFAEALQTRVNSLTADFVSRDDPFQRARVGDDRQKALAEMDRVKADIERFKKLIAEIEEDARQAGVPPGWLR